MNKTITLSKTDWETIIEGLSYAFEEAQEAEGYDENPRAESYKTLINLIAKKIA